MLGEYKAKNKKAINNVISKNIGSTKNDEGEDEAVAEKLEKELDTQLAIRDDDDDDNTILKFGDPELFLSQIQDPRNLEKTQKMLDEYKTKSRNVINYHVGNNIEGNKKTINNVISKDEGSTKNDKGEGRAMKEKVEEELDTLPAIQDDDDDDDGTVSTLNDPELFLSRINDPRSLAKTIALLGSEGGEETDSQRLTGNHQIEAIDENEHFYQLKTISSSCEESKEEEEKQEDEIEAPILRRSSLETIKRPGAHRIRGITWDGVGDDDDGTHIPCAHTAFTNTANVAIPEPPKKRKKKWLMVTILMLIIGAIVIGLGVGLSGNGDNGAKDITDLSFPEERCAYNEAKEISIARKRCLCQENATDIPEVYQRQYDLIKTTLLEKFGLDLYYIDPCEPTNIAMLWLAEEIVENNTVYDDYRVVSRFALAVCFLSWYDYNKLWKNKKGWMTSENECKWFGVMCNEKNEVISLSLRNNQLAGSIPEQLVILSQLSRLDLNDNAITGSIPTELGSLNSLVRLDLQNNKIARRVPTEIGQLTLLKDIDLSSNFISGTLPTSIASCVALQELRLTNNMLITTIPTELGNLGNLEILDLSYQEELNGVIPTTIGSCASLNEIRLDIGRKMTGIIPTEIGQLSDLQVFSAGYNELSGSIPSTFANLSQLAILNLMANRLTGVISPSIGIYNALLRQIRLTGNLISGSIPTEIGLLSNLIALEIAETKIEGYIPMELGLCTSLQLIDVSYNIKLIGEVPSELGALSGLETFNLANTAMVGNMPLEICELPKLETLVADCYTKITNCECCTICF